ncbi:hypothetical protein ANTHELSMS3_04108 [Antarctobacter heliothermus]|uniref:DUF4336 domain-containing protein n=1 Tax=Antarctobacter heliothermus TaxID=74033 RepID=A0A222E944_9RHOB|nr:DUF4336 domain-containing protein [Antarctobacter heliothermus]ASP22714.1 hypothetical protein ANTHELSMS3_04108 [Antarctobacter heliothermus]
MTSLILLGHDLWTAEGPPVRGAGGFDFPTRMCLARLTDGSLWVHSPIALAARLKAEIDELGPIRHLVAPNDLHHRFLADWAAAFPAAIVHAAPGVAQKSPGVVVDDVLTPEPPAIWADLFQQVIFGGNMITTEVVFFHNPSSTLIFTDLLQQMPSGWYKGWRALVARADLMTGELPSVPRKFRIAFRNRRALRAGIAKLRRLPVQQIVMAHGPVVERNAAKVLDHAFAWAR